jgi:cytidylate kinase
MVYRAVGLEVILSGGDLGDVKTAETFAKELTFPKMIELSRNPDFRSDVGAKGAYHVAAMPEVRDALLKMQQDFALNPVFGDGTPAKGVIYDGRDTGTVVCPNADLKLYVTASPEVRATRRYEEFLSKGINKTYEDVYQEVKARDEKDYTRKGSHPAEDAIILDTSNLSREDVFAKASAIIDERLK